jgi:ABC-type Mn2+/Zn2+ transport system permease subunit
MLGGLAVSFALNLPAGASIVTLASVVYVATLIVKKGIKRQS